MGRMAGQDAGVEVAEVHAALGAEQHVGRLHVAVEHAGGVGVVERAGQLDTDPGDGCGPRQPGERRKCRRVGGHPEPRGGGRRPHGVQEDAAVAVAGCGAANPLHDVRQRAAGEELLVDEPHPRPAGGRLELLLVVNPHDVRMVELGQRAGLVAPVARHLEGHDPPHGDLSREIHGGKGPLPRLGEHEEVVHCLARPEAVPSGGGEARGHRPLDAAEPAPDLGGPAREAAGELRQFHRLAPGLPHVVLLADELDRRSVHRVQLRERRHVLLDPRLPPVAAPKLDVDLHKFHESQPPQGGQTGGQMRVDGRRGAFPPRGDERLEPLGHHVPRGGLFARLPHARGLPKPTNHRLSTAPGPHAAIPAGSDSPGWRGLA